jgi:CheY-like chemotaxis protein
MTMNDPIKALYVDDDDDMRELVGLALARHGIEVAGAASAEEALPRLGEVDVLVADLGLSGMSGRELCERARDVLPIVIVTGDREASTERRELGARAVLIKPVTMQDLADAIHRAHAT